MDRCKHPKVQTEKMIAPFVHLKSNASFVHLTSLCSNQKYVRCWRKCHSVFFFGPPFSVMWQVRVFFLSKSHYVRTHTCTYTYTYERVHTPYFYEQFWKLRLRRQMSRLTKPSQMSCYCRQPLKVLTQSVFWWRERITSMDVSSWS